MIIDFVEDRTHQVDPEEILEERLINDIIGQVLKNHLSLLEYAVITRLLQGYTASEIEEEMGIGLKVIDNARTRVKTKLRRLIDEYGSLLSPQVPTNVRKRKDLYLNVPS
jgi:RNA polymerase sporulation-specific sigma factor